MTVIAIIILHMYYSQIQSQNFPVGACPQTSSHADVLHTKVELMILKRAII